MLYGYILKLTQVTVCESFPFLHNCTITNLTLFVFIHSFIHTCMASLLKADSMSNLNLKFGFNQLCMRIYISEIGASSMPIFIYKFHANLWISHFPKGSREENIRFPDDELGPWNSILSQKAMRKFKNIK